MTSNGNQGGRGVMHKAFTKDPTACFSHPVTTTYTPSVIAPAGQKCGEPCGSLGPGGGGATPLLGEAVA